MYCTQCGVELREGDRFCSQCGRTTPLGLSEQPVAPARKIVRPMRSKVIAGVCAGVGQYFGVDVIFVRLLWLSSVLLAGTGVLAYLICWVVIPREEVLVGTVRTVG